MQEVCCGSPKALSNDFVNAIRALGPIPGLNMDIVLDTWRTRPWPHFVQGNIALFHAPLGNSLLLEEGHKVKVFISTYCVSPPAGLKYVLDVIAKGRPYHDAEIAAVHTYDSGTMRGGIRKMSMDLHIAEYVGLQGNADILSLANDSRSPICFTQALCPISRNGTWEGYDVWRALRESESLRRLASGSLTVWLEELYQHSDDNTRLLLCGKTNDIGFHGEPGQRAIEARCGAQLVKTLQFSRVEDQRVVITTRDQSPHSVYDSIRADFGERLYVVPHPAKYDRNRPAFLETEGFHWLQ